MNVLALELSTVRGSVAALRGGELVLAESFASERGHSSGFFGSVEVGLRLLGRCDRIAVGLGPGSYSGVRIAISAALGLSLPTGAELVGLSSVLAFASATPAYRVIGDARRGTFFFAEIREGVCVEGPVLLTPEVLRDRLATCGIPVFSSAPLPSFPEARLQYPEAARLARLAARDAGIVARANLEPLYLREPHITQAKPVVPPPR